MDRLKTQTKVKASSLAEMLVATVILMIVFGIAMASIGNVLERSVKSSTHEIDTQLHKQIYLYQNGMTKAPDALEYKQWNIQIKESTEGTVRYVTVKGVHKITRKTRTQKIVLP